MVSYKWEWSLNRVTGGHKSRFHCIGNYMFLSVIKV